MQVLFSRAAQARTSSCRCTSCGRAAKAVARRTTTAVPKRRVGAGDIFTACYSTLLASAAIADAEVKRERRKEWDRVIEEARSGKSTDAIGAGGESQLDREMEQKTYSKLSAQSSSACLGNVSSSAAAWQTVQVSGASSASKKDISLQGKLRALDLRIKQSLSAAAVDPQSSRDAELEDDANSAGVEEWADENPLPGMSFREPQSRLHLDKREASISRLVMRLLGEISIYSNPASAGVEELSSETKLVLEAIEGLHSDFSKFPNYNWNNYDLVCTTRSKLHRSLYKICQRTAPRKSAVDSMIAKICYNLLISAAPPNIITYNILIGELSRLGQHNLAELVINSYFCDTRYTPNMETIQLMLENYIARGDRRGFLLMLDRLRGTGPGGKPVPGEPIGNMRIGMRSIKLLYLEEIQSWAAHHAPIHRNGQLIRKAPRNKEIFETIIRGCLEMNDLRRAIRYLKAALKEGQKIRSEWIVATASACVENLDVRAGQKLVDVMLSFWRDENGDPLLDFPRYVRYAIYQLFGLCGVQVSNGTATLKRPSHILPVVLRDLLFHLEIESIKEKLNRSADWILRLRSALSSESPIERKLMRALMLPLTHTKKLQRSQNQILRRQIQHIEHKVILSETKLVQHQKAVISWTYGTLSRSSQRFYDAYASDVLAKNLVLLSSLVQKNQEPHMEDRSPADMYIRPVVVEWDVPTYGHALSIGH